MFITTFALFVAFVCNGLVSQQLMPWHPCSRKLQTKRLRHAEMTEPEIMMEIMIITSEREQGDVQGCKQCAEQENPSVVIALLDAAASGRFHGEWTLGGKERVGKEVAAPVVWTETSIAEVRARLQQ